MKTFAAATIRRLHFTRSLLPHICIAQSIKTLKTGLCDRYREVTGRNLYHLSNSICFLSFATFYSFFVNRKTFYL